jgi:Holliday junction resolvase RusA-like endonuclease
METSKQYIIFGNPIPLQRPRYTPSAVWDSQKGLKMTCSGKLEEQHGSSPLFEGPLGMQIIFYMPIPHSVTHKKVTSKYNTYHFIKPDISNLIKFYEDVATGIVYKDDSIICHTFAEKRYDDGKGPRTEMTIFKLKTTGSPVPSLKAEIQIGSVTIQLGDK